MLLLFTEFTNLSKIVNYDAVSIIEPWVLYRPRSPCLEQWRLAPIPGLAPGSMPPFASSKVIPSQFGPSRRFTVTLQNDLSPQIGTDN